MPTTSNLYQFTDSSSSLLLRAFNLAGIRPTAVTQEHLDDARQCMNLIFSDWANKGINLWSVDLQIIPMIGGVPTYAIDPATVAILDSYISSVQGPTTQDRIMVSMTRSEYATFPNKLQIGVPSRIWFDQLLPSQIYQSVALSAITSISGTGLVGTLTYPGTEALAQGAPIQISNCSITSFNGVVLVASSTVNGGIVTVNFPSLATGSVAGSGNISLQTMTGPTVTLYLVPDGITFQYLKFYRLRQNQFSDLPNGQIPEIPYSWMMAFVDSLAYQLARTWSPDKAPMLKAEASESYAIAAGRNVEVAPIFITPEYGSYSVL
jgi:hypothetical protein